MTRLALLLAAVGLLVVLACAQEAPTPTSAPAPTPTSIPLPTPTPTTLAPTPTPTRPPLPTPTPTATPVPEPVPPPGGVAVRITAPVVTLSPGQETTLSVELFPGALGISGGEIIIGVDPRALRLLSVEPGDLLGANPLIGIQYVAADSGNLRMALARAGATAAPSPRGVLVRIRMAVLSNTPDGSYPVQVTSIGLADQNIQRITRIEVQPFSFRVTSAAAPSTPGPAPTAPAPTPPGR
ncbi:MAG: hypothetical protein HYU29_07740 [Chloroflexi bacterium]|nr:hypothetical protein [Chloroflexota bacterium]